MSGKKPAYPTPQYQAVVETIKAHLRPYDESVPVKSRIVKFTYGHSDYTMVEILKGMGIDLGVYSVRAIRQNELGRFFITNKRRPLYARIEALEAQVTDLKHDLEAVLSRVITLEACCA